MEQMESDEVRDPLFMNIVKLAQLPLASKKPLNIKTAETLESTAASSNTTPLTEPFRVQAAMQN